MGHYSFFKSSDRKWEEFGVILVSNAINKLSSIFLYVSAHHFYTVVT